MQELDSEIIALERSLRDPEQDAEFRAEFYAEARMLGVRDDIHLYMHTPHEEELFQERIQHQVDYGYWDEEDGWVDGIHGYDDCEYGPCPTCHTMSDEWMSIDGHDCCDTCGPDAEAFMHFIGRITSTEVLQSGRWGTDLMFTRVERDLG
jgi:hypothetical protein